MLRLSSLSVSNFRSIHEETFTFPEFSAIVGKNDAGKSNLLAAIQLLFEGGNLGAIDFYDLKKPIILEGTFENAADYTALCDSKNRSKVEERIDSTGRIRIRRISDEAQKLGKIEIHDPSENSFGTPTGIDAALKPLFPEIIFIGALDDVSMQADSSKKGAAGKLMAQILGRVRQQVQSQLDAAYSEASKLLNLQTTLEDGSTLTVDNRLPELKDVESRITDHLQEMFPRVKAALSVQLPVADDLFKSVDIFIKEGDHSDPYFRRGHGLQRALHLSLLRVLAFYIRQESSKSLSRPFLLLLEEPETCLHPDGQVKMRRALDEISKQEQVIIATHSPILIAPEMIERTIRLEKSTKKDTLKPFTVKHGPVQLLELEASERQINQLFEIQRSSKFLFAKAVLLVEGISDECLISAAANALKSFDFDFEEIAIVESGGKGKTVTFMSVLKKMGFKTWALLDLDFLWSDAGVAFDKEDDRYSKFMEKLNTLVPSKEGDKTESDKKQEKEKKITACTGELRESVLEICQYLNMRDLYVLSRGDIETYFRIGQNGKHRYAEVSAAVKSKQQPIDFAEDFTALFSALKKWSLENHT